MTGVTPAEHRTEAVEALENLDPSLLGDEQLLLYAQVHATLALAPQQPAQAAEPSRRWQLDQLHPFLDSTGGTLSVIPAHGVNGVIVSVGDEGLLFEDPATLRALASLLTAHADRMEKP